MKTLVVNGLVILGILLLLLSFLWSTLFPATNNWTEAKAQEMRELSRTAHLLSFKANAAAKVNMQGGASSAEVAAEYRQAQEKLRVLREEFEGSRDAPVTTANYLRWTGIGMVLVGGLAVMSTRGG